MNPTVASLKVTTATAALVAWTSQEARILIVSAMRSQVTQLESLLRSAGYSNVLGIHPPSTRVRIWPPVDLVLLQLRLPDLHGFDAIAPLLDHCRDGHPPPVLAITTGTGDSWQALQAGAKDCISAPFNPIELLARMRHLIETQHMHRQLVARMRELEQRLQRRTDAWHSSESRCSALTALITHPDPAASAHP